MLYLYAHNCILATVWRAIHISPTDGVRWVARLVRFYPTIKVRRTGASAATPASDDSLNLPAISLYDRPGVIADGGVSSFQICFQPRRCEERHGVPRCLFPNAFNFVWCSIRYTSVTFTRPNAPVRFQVLNRGATKSHCLSGVICLGVQGACMVLLACRYACLCSCHQSISRTLTCASM